MIYGVVVYLMCVLDFCQEESLDKNDEEYSIFLY